MTAANQAQVTLVYLIKQLESATRFQMDEIVATEGLTLAQYTALTVVERHPHLTSADLARNSFVRAQSMAQLVNGLETDGLITRRRDEENRRQFFITLTEKAVTMLGRLREPVDAIEARMTEGLSTEQISNLYDSLRACRVALGGSHAR
ncbi:MarR family transcriptional regulator [Subtercola sp. RTI3]|uniref:MarR family winged helix-turn-helix transcriptional regulator n=1 Tax=Subtercola sp. RTI3 TaxID=3048639 RepID=UPI002B228892|nr:MarR family transcriptional regulator [Subtercola sp. RTI3]